MLSLLSARLEANSNTATQVKRLDPRRCASKSPAYMKRDKLRRRLAESHSTSRNALAQLSAQCKACSCASSSRSFLEARGSHCIATCKHICKHRIMTDQSRAIDMHSSLHAAPGIFLQALSCAVTVLIFYADMTTLTLVASRNTAEAGSSFVKLAGLCAPVGAADLGNKKCHKRQGIES